MRHRLFAIALAPILALGLTAVAPAQDADELTKKAEAVKADPNSAEKLNEYMGLAINTILTSMESDPDAAQEAFAEMKALVEGLEPEQPEAKQLLQQARQVVPLIEQRLELARSSLDDLKQKLSENVNDPQAVAMYVARLELEVGPKIQSDPERAEQLLTEGRDFLLASAEKASDKQAYAQAMQSLEQLGGVIESNLALTRMVGQDAAPLAVEAWVNGEPLSDSDLKGKVVLLDFWAVWCGPCIATFPHLIEWHEKYGDKGLVIIGLTNYYEFGWDDDSGRAVPKPGTSPEEERAMLEKFAESYNLQHRFALQDGDAMSEYYNVSGIPQVVLIDQEGKIQMVRVGSGEQNARDIGGKIAELLGEQEQADE